MSETIKTTNTSVTYDSNPGAADERHSLQTYVSDLLALTKHIEEPIARQLQIKDSANYGEAIAIIDDIKRVMATQEATLEVQLQALGGHPAAGIKSAWSALIGFGAAAIDSVRTTKVSKSLRDDYTALSLTAISYTMLHATALGLGNTAVAEVAQLHLGQITPIIIRISKALPAIVLAELRADGENVRVSAAELSAQTTHAAWQ